MAKYRIIALDGGGIKGLFTATLLDRLVRGYPKLIENVDLLAGTSTGGILALGLAAGKTPAALASLYREHGGRIFDDSLWDDMVDLGNVVGAEYDLGGLKRALRQVLGRRKLRDLEKTVLVPAFDLDAEAAGDRPRMWKPKFFHNHPGRDFDGNELVVDVALRTSAAPAYFPSYQGFIDGGVVANNPSLAALAQALDRRAARRKIRDIVLLSVGSGTEPTFIRGQRKNWGWAQWARPLVSLMVSGLTGVPDYQCRQILEDRYFRLDTYLDRGLGLDDAKPATLDYLVEAARKVDLRRALSWLRRRGW